MKAFGLVLMFIVFGFSIAFSEFEQEFTFWDFLVNTYKLMYGDFEFSQEFSTS